MSATWRPRYHITGDRNWINDPNGPVQHRGTHHLFYQANPDGPFWGPPRWGHVTSPDLVRWTRRPVALTPTPGTADADGCWSGCVRLADGRAAAYYTGVLGNDDAQRAESVCRAYSADDTLERWEQDPAGPLIPAPGTGPHRDPFVWEDGDGRHLIVAAGAEVLRYDSPDGDAWRFGDVFFTAAGLALAAAPGGELHLGAPWECPHLVFSGAEAALVLSCQGARGEPQAVAFAGAIRSGRFEGELAGRLDHGDVFYAPALTVGAPGGELLWGWAQERLDRERQSTLSHAGALTLPRRVGLAEGRLVTRPARELEALRAKPLPRGAAHPQMELALCGGGSWTLSAGGAEVVVRIAGDSVLMTVAGDAGVRRFSAPLTARAEHALRVFVDGSLVEAVADDGDAWITTRAYPPAGGWDSATATGDAAAWRLRDDVIAAAG